MRGKCDRARRSLPSPGGLFSRMEPSMQSMQIDKSRCAPRPRPAPRARAWPEDFEHRRGHRRRRDLPQTRRACRSLADRATLAAVDRTLPRANWLALIFKGDHLAAEATSARHRPTTCRRSTAPPPSSCPRRRAAGDARACRCDLRQRFRSAPRRLVASGFTVERSPHRFGRARPAVRPAASTCSSRATSTRAAAGAVLQRDAFPWLGGWEAATQIRRRRARNESAFALRRIRPRHDRRPAGMLDNPAWARSTSSERREWSPRTRPRC